MANSNTVFPRYVHNERGSLDYTVVKDTLFELKGKVYDSDEKTPLDITDYDLVYNINSKEDGTGTVFYSVIKTTYTTTDSPIDGAYSFFLANNWVVDTWQYVPTGFARYEILLRDAENNDIVVAKGMLEVLGDLGGAVTPLPDPGQGGATIIPVNEILVGDGTASGFAGSGILKTELFSQPVYDPTLVEGDVFNMENMTEGANKKILTATERNKLDNITVTIPVDLDTINSRINELDASVILKGEWDASSGSFPGGWTAKAGYAYIVSVAWTVDSIEFNLKDRLIAILDDASTSTFASNWIKVDTTDEVVSVVWLTGAISKANLLNALNIEEWAIADLVSDLTPQLWGDLDLNGKKIVTTGNGDIVLSPNGTGEVKVGTEKVIDQWDVGVSVQGYDVNTTKSDLENTFTEANTFTTTRNTAGLEVNTQTGTTYTLVLGDAGKVLTLTNASAITLTVPTHASVAFVIWAVITLEQHGAWQVTIVASGGVTINSKESNLKITGQWSGAYLRKTATDTWLLLGDLSA